LRLAARLQSLAAMLRARVSVCVSVRVPVRVLVRVPVRVLVVVGASLVALTVPGAGRAAADEPSWTLDEVRSPVAREAMGDFALTDASLTWRVDAAAGVTGRGAREGGARLGEASVAAEIAITGEACDVLVLGGQADLRSDRDDVAVQQWGSLCPIAGLFTLRIDHRLEWAVTPRLLAPPRLRAGGTWRETVGIGYAIRLGTAVEDDGERYYLEAATVRMAPTLSWVPGRAELFDMGVIADMSFLRFVRERTVSVPAGAAIDRRDLRFIEAHIEASPQSSGALAMTFELDGLRMEGWRAFGVTWGGAIGLGAADVTEPAVLPPGTMLPAGTEVYDQGMAMGPTFALHGERAIGGLVARVGVDRVLWPIGDGLAVIDDEVTASVRGERGGWRGAIEAVAARGHLVHVDGVTSAPRGGLAVDVERALAGPLVARAHVEAGRSVYASGASFDAPAWGAEASLSIGVHAGNR
jgi:hypothetical protein